MTRATIALVSLAAFLGLCTPAWALNFTVNSQADAVDAVPGNGVCETAAGNGVCTLRAAVQEADASSGADVITLPAGFYGFSIAGDDDAAAAGDLDVTQDLTLTGAGARSTTIDPEGIDRAFAVLGAGVHFSISGVAITGGFSDNGGAIDNGGTLTITDSWLHDNSVGDGDGGAIESGGPLNITRSALTGNTGYNGGALDLGSSTTAISDTTISGNHAGNLDSNGDGGGMDVGTGPLTITNSTIVDNQSFNGASSGGGIDGTATLRGTIVAHNFAFQAGTTNPGVLDNCENTAIDLGNNLEDADTCGLHGASDVHGNPLLGPLEDNGGPSDTRALLAGSPAIGHGPGGANCPATDQRGVARPQGGACDIGAYEFAPPSVSTGPATGVASTTAVLGASVNPNALPTGVHFEYGTTAAYGSSTAEVPGGDGVSAGAVAAAVAGLKPGTTYHYRVVATSADGSLAGVDSTFTTAAAADHTAPRVTVGHLPKKLKLKALLRGLKVKAKSSERTAFTFELKGFARRVTLAKRFNIILASKSLKLATGSRSVKLKPSRKLLSHSRRFTVQVVVTATDAAGNHKTVTRTIKVAR